MKMSRGQAGWWAKHHFRTANRLYEESNKHDDFDVIMHLHAAAHHHNVLGGKYREHFEDTNDRDGMADPRCTCMKRSDDDGGLLDILQPDLDCPVHSPYVEGTP